MSDKYGVTPTGFVKKRLDTIIDEIHDSLTKDWGVNTRNNPKSYLNVLITDFADKIAELWEVAEESYLAKYPATAEGMSLDHAAEYGGSTREQAAPSYYSIKCTGENGTEIPEGTLLETETKPVIQLKNYNKSSISTDSCCRVKLYSTGSGSNYGLNIDKAYAYAATNLCNPSAANIAAVNAWTEWHDAYLEWLQINRESYMAEHSDATEADLIAAFNAYSGYTTPVETVIQPGSDTNSLMYLLTHDSAHNGTLYTVEYVEPSLLEGRESLIIDFGDSSHEVELSTNLYPAEVTSVNTFGTVDTGDIDIATGRAVSDTSDIPSINIKSSVAGFKSVEAIEGYISGRKLETDTEFRKSYIDKIFIRSRTMLESITSAILQNVPEVKACKAFQNDTHVYQKHRPPHSVEVVVECSNSDELYKEIAEQIMATKAAGIQTCNCLGLVFDNATGTWGPISGLAAAGNDPKLSPYAVEVEVDDDYGYKVPIRFTLPVEFKIGVTVNCTRDRREEAYSSNTEDLIRNVIKQNINSLGIGEALIPDKFLYKLYQEVPGFLKFEIQLSYDWIEYVPTYSVNQTTGKWEASLTTIEHSVDKEAAEQWQEDYEDYLDDTLPVNPTAEEIEEATADFIEENGKKPDYQNFTDVPENCVCRFDDEEFVCNIIYSA